MSHELLCAAGGVVAGVGVTLLIQHLRGSTPSSSAAGAVPSGKRVAVVLSGCGYLDGSEITEATSALIQLQAAGAEVSCFAPDRKQMHVVNHITSTPDDTSRNCLEEAARIARGDVKALTELSADSFDALVVVGGFGAAKNLCDFAVNGPSCSVAVDMQDVVNSFRKANKPMGFSCIAPVIPAKLLKGCKITLGCAARSESDDASWPYAGSIASAKVMGAETAEADVNEVVVDLKNKLVTTPAYMKNASFFEVFTGMGAMVSEVLKLAN